MRLRLKELREAQFMTQRELSSKAGIAQATIVRLEQGQHEPTFQTIKKLAVSKGMGTLRVDGARKVLRGITSVAEVIRATEEEGAIAQI